MVGGTPILDYQGYIINGLYNSFNIDHDATTDLVVWLATDSWNNESANLVVHPLATGDDWGWVDGYAQTVEMTVLYDGSSDSWFQQSQVVNQTWYLAVKDEYGGNEGRIDSWSITINYHYRVQPWIEVDDKSVNTGDSQTLTGELHHSSGDPDGKKVYGEIIVTGGSNIDLGYDYTYGSPLNHGQFKFTLSGSNSQNLCDSDYTILVWFNGDLDYYPAEGAGTLTVHDTTEPDRPRNLTDNVDGYTTDNTPTFEWDSPNDACGIRRYRYSTTDSSPDDNDSYTSNEYITLGAQPDGLNYFYVAAEDYQGNIGTPASHAFHIDTSPPPPPGNLDDGYAGWSNTDQPTFTWSVPSDDSSISGYY